jgi:hypothetical protein
MTGEGFHLIFLFRFTLGFGCSHIWLTTATSKSRSGLFFDLLAFGLALTFGSTRTVSVRQLVQSFFISETPPHFLQAISLLPR